MSKTVVGVFPINSHSRTESLFRLCLNEPYTEDMDYDIREEVETEMLIRYEFTYPYNLKITSVDSFDEVDEFEQYGQSPFGDEFI